jgi:hypothetical protein
VHADRCLQQHQVLGTPGRLALEERAHAVDRLALVRAGLRPARGLQGGGAQRGGDLVGVRRQRRESVHPIEGGNDDRARSRAPDLFAQERSHRR